MSFLSRRSFFKKAVGGAGLVASGVGLGALGAGALKEAMAEDTPPAPDKNSVTIPFWDHHQAGITTPSQGYTYFAAFDLTATKREQVVQILKAWTEAAAKLTAGQAIGNVDAEPGKTGADSGEALGLAPSRLTLTFGFGPGLFSKNGVDRYGLARARPEAFVDLPKFNGDQLVEAKCGGDLSVQACADDPQVAFHAVRQLARLAGESAQVRWAQTGFSSSPSDPSATGRNLMGFRDGTQQPAADQLDRFVWVKEGPKWMHGGSYLVTRRIRISLEHWDGTEVDFQEQVVGRHKISGAPLGKSHEREGLGLDRADKDGNFVIPENAHVRLANSATNDGAQILRRGYSYNDGVNFTAERWPPWRQGMEYDAGLFFVAYQNDLRRGFIKIFEKMSKLDALNQFCTHVASGVFACPPGAKKGEYIGQKLFG